ncbi:MAG: ABC transporter permease [Chloroherpetonaceae bacterium]|jgi:putative ABC transport system permease protein
MEKLLDTIRQAFDSIRTQKLRAFLTILSIVIGVFAIMFAGSLVSSINSTINQQLSALGENTFYITRMPSINIGGGHQGRLYWMRPHLDIRQFQKFATRMQDVAIVTAITGSSGFVVKAGNLSTDPDVSLVGTDDKYFLTSNQEILEGRALTPTDIQYNRKVAIIGNDIIVKIFPRENPIGKEIRINNRPFTVIGILKPQGALMGQSQDNQIIIPVNLFLINFASRWEQDLTFVVRSPDKISLSSTIDEAVGNLRIIRNLKPYELNNFELETNESLSEQFASLTGYLSYFGVFSGVIALLSAGIGITNIMYISVKERTREIGIRKAVGATKRWIVFHFIFETVVITTLGGIFGIIVGFGFSAAFGLILGTKITLSLQWTLISLIVSIALGLISGVFPAWRAASLNPVDALRYE